MNTENNSNKLGIMPVPQLILKLSLPMILSLLTNALYNLVDSIFVAQMNEKALAALSLAAPVQILMAALGSGMAVGLNAVISRAMGEKNRTAVRQTASAALFLALCSYMLIVLTCLTLLKPFFAWQTSDPEIAGYGIAYLQVCMLLSVGCMHEWVFDRF